VRLVVHLRLLFLGGRRFLILHLVRIVTGFALLLGSRRDRKLRTIVSTRTLVLPLRLPFLGGGRLLVLLVLLLPFHGCQFQILTAALIYNDQCHFLTFLPSSCFSAWWRRV
jgi:hypothetical protein